MSKIEEEEAAGKDPDSDDSNEDGAPAKKIPNLFKHPAKKFKLGEFECPCVHRVILPLHWRFNSNTALNAIIQLVLHPFAVSNRKNLFVYKTTSERIFYLRIFELNLPSSQNEPTVSSPSSSSYKSPRSPGLIAGEKVSPKPGFSPNSQRLGSSSFRSSSTSSSSALAIEIYGIGNCDSEISSSLIQLIEAKLNSLTLNKISTR